MKWIQTLLCCLSLVAARELSALDVLFEAKGACFYPWDEDVRKIYATGFGEGGFELSCQSYRDLYTWVSVDAMHEKGTSLGIPYVTKITIVPIGLGLKYLFPISFADLYVGAGILGTYMYEKDYDPFVVRTTPRWWVGGIGKIGSILNVNRHVFFDLFTNYSYVNFGQLRNDPGIVANDADLSGFSFGLGVGIRFGERDWDKQPAPKAKKKKRLCLRPPSINPSADLF